MNIFTLALGPVIAIFFFFWVKDRYEREPLKRLLFTGGAGVISAIPVVIVEILWVHTSYDISALSLGELSFMTFVEIGLTEEFFKAAAFFSVAYWSRHMNEPYDGIMYSVAAALGFAGVENVMYVLGGGIPAAFIRAITAVPAHAMFGLFIGYFAGRAKFAKHTWTKPFLILIGFGISVVLHGLYDLIAMWPYHPLAWLWLFPLLGAMVGASLFLIKEARNRSPFKPEKDEFGRYTGYTVSGQPLSPKIAAKLKVAVPPGPRPQPIQPPQFQPSPRPHVDQNPKEPSSNGPYFLDEYFKPSPPSSEPPPPPLNPPISDPTQGEIGKSGRNLGVGKDHLSPKKDK